MLHANDPQNTCHRCGTCCQKGGPAFHKTDQQLLESGRIRMADVYTIREGEPIYDNVRDGISVAASDIIKIKGVQGAWTCRFLELHENGCRIYDIRPLECQVMKCWDTGDIELIYELDRLTRRDLLSEVDGLWELIDDHQLKCSYHQIRDLLEKGNGNLEGEAKDRVLDMVKYDLAIRPMMVEKGQLESEMIDFLLGRPLIETISLFGLKIVKEGGAYRFAPKPRPAKP